MNNKYLSFDEQNELIKKSIGGDEKATVALINLCYPIAGKIAKQYASSNADIQDLMQEAVYGILLAIPRYRPNMGTKFTTYCTFWIQKKMRQYAEMNFIKCPEKKINKLKEYSFFIEEFKKNEGREPSNEEIMEGIGVSEEDVRSFKEFPSSYFILDEVSAYLPWDGEDVADIAVLHVLLEEALEYVNENERQVIIWRFGLFSSPFRTYKEISKDLNCSKEWVRQLELSGLKKMKKYFSKIGFSD